MAHSKYEGLLASKRLRHSATGKEVPADAIHPLLFPFQRDLTRWAIRKGRSAIFADTGLGKTFMQLEWARLLDCPVLIIAPLSVARQTVNESERLGIHLDYVRNQSQVRGKISITNYEMAEHFDASLFQGVVMDESSILKSYGGIMRRRLTVQWSKTPYRLCCTATPAPNDVIEIGRHSEFLGVMTNGEMLSAFFIHDGGGASKPGGPQARYRLKGHARSAFYEWMASWAMTIRKPSDLGYSDEGYDLPPLEIIPHYVESDYVPEGYLFFTRLKGVQDRARVRKATIAERCAIAAELANANGDQWLLWSGLNEESRILAELVPGGVEVQGSQSPEDKAAALESFQDGKIRVLITKPSIAGFGMNFQNAHNMAFVGLDDSYEKYYQAIRRCYRFGQTKAVNAHIILATIQRAIYANVRRKEEQALSMSRELLRNLRRFEQEEVLNISYTDEGYVMEESKGSSWKMLLGDAVERMAEVETGSVGHIVYSPPFNNLFVYSPSPRDVGNAKNIDEFMEHYKFIMQESLRVLMERRTCAVHVQNLLASRTHHGYIGMIDFRGDIIRAHQELGWERRITGSCL